MFKLSRREWLSWAGIASVAGLVVSTDTRAEESLSRVSFTEMSSRERIRDRYFPNVELTTHEGKKVRFYEDLIKDKIVVFNFMYATCDGVCPGITRNLVKVQRLLGNRVGKDIFMYSITLKPVDDTVEVLADYVKENRVKPGWLFLTGKPEDIELIRRRQGFVDLNPEVDKDVSQHTGNVRYGNEPLQFWASSPGLGMPEALVKSILWMDQSSDRPTESLTNTTKKEMRRRAVKKSRQHSTGSKAEKGER
ncbi:MAG: SCO family protein [Blastocatellia bacterium]|nr:SCO family protein [Blastocatellia bacterium]